MTRHHDLERPEPAAPALLLMFLAAAMTVVGAVVAIGVTDSDWVLAGAVAVLAVVLALLLRALSRVLREDDSPSGPNGESGGASAPATDER